MKRATAVIIIMIFLPQIASAQILESETIDLSFQRGLDYYRWGTSVSKLFRINGENFNGSGDFYTMLRQPPGFPNQWKTSFNLNASWYKNLNRNTALQGNAGAEYFYDHQVSQSRPFLLNQLYPSSIDYAPTIGGLTTGLDNRIIRQSAGIGIALEDVLGLKVIPQAGVFGESFMEVNAVGPTGNLTVEAGEMMLGGFKTDFQASAGGQFLHQRTHRDISASFSASRRYSPESFNLFTADYNSYVREFPLSSNVSDRRFEEEYRIGNTLLYSVYSSFDLELDLNFARRHVEPTTFGEINKLDELSTGLKAGIAGELGKHHLQFSFTADGQNQNYPFRTVEGRQFGLFAQDDFCFRGDSLKLSGMLSRYKYDISPEAFSIDTRDEIRHSYQIVYFHTFGEGLELQAQLRADLYHLVYMKSMRSADNNWERFFLFSPEVNYYSDSWSQRAKFRVSADYIDYDFEESAPPSRVFRKFSAEDSLYINLFAEWGLKVQYLLLLEDGGALDWDAFIQELSDEYHTNDGSAMLMWRGRKLIYGFGWSYYCRQAYHSDAEGKMNPGERIEMYGPLISVKGIGPWGLEIEMSTSYRNISESGKESYSQTMVDLALFKAL